tara:strand:+ start:1134 stop:1637 length:504 start_codon:yes stop_codon:yes gene_type:complete
MVKIKQAVFDTGPLIHLHEINKLRLLELFQRILITPEILKECEGIKNSIRELKNLEEKNLSGKNKDLAKYLINRHNLHLGESTGIALCHQELIKLFFTDDLDAKQVAKNLGFESHGTIAIILRSWRNRKLTKKEVKETIEDLYSSSSLFLTSDLKEWVLDEVERFGK